jgi:hypothetical protein
MSVLELAARSRRRATELTRPAAASAAAATAATPPASTTFAAFCALAVLADLSFHDRCGDLAAHSNGLGCLDRSCHFFARRSLA